MTRQGVILSRHEQPDRLPHWPQSLPFWGALANGETEAQRGRGAAQGHTLKPLPPITFGAPPTPGSSLSTSILGAFLQSMLTRPASKITEAPPRPANEAPPHGGYANETPGGPAPPSTAESARRGQARPTASRSPRLPAWLAVRLSIPPRRGSLGGAGA